MKELTGQGPSQMMMTGHNVVLRGLNKGGRKCRKVEWERGGHDLVLLQGIRFGQSSADRHYVGASFVGML